MMHMGIDGVVVPQHKNPFILHRGYFSQEIILHSYDEVLTRDTSNQLDWTNWAELKKSVPELMENGMALNMSAALKNRDFVMTKWFYKQQKLEADLLKSPKFKSEYVKAKDSKSLSVCTLNMLGFQSIVASQSTEDCIDHLCTFVKSINCDVLCMQEIHRGGVRELIPKLRDVGFIHNTNLSEKFGNIIFSKMSIKNSTELVIRETDDNDNSSKHSRTAVTVQMFIELLKITTTHLSIGARYHDEGYSKAEITKIKKENNKIRLEEVKKIIDIDDADSDINMGSDIILGDFNAGSDDEAIKYILANGYTTNYSKITESNPFGTIVDHIFLSKDFIKQYKSHRILSYPYVWSDHNAIILIIDDFF
jgi:exonuclease III